MRLDAFRHAILAPNPHNRQPWLIRLEGADRALLFCDLDKRLPATDPYDRQITIGFGTFIETACIAAAERGVALDVLPFPDGEPGGRLDRRPIAQLTFRADGAAGRDPLYSAIPARRTNRELYAPTAPSAADLREIEAEGVAVSNDIGLTRQIAHLASDAMALETMTPRTWKESVDLTRIGAREIDARPDGLAMQGPLIESLSAAGLLTRAKLANPESFAFREALATVREMYASVPAIIWIKTGANRRADQLDAGRRYVRANLRATMLGLAMHPMSQSLQEYPEMTSAYSEVHRLLGAADGERLQMLARTGRAAEVPPSPRWPLQAHLA